MKHKRYPQIRFKGFNDDWEQRKLGDISEIVGGGTPSTNIDEYWNGDINWYSPAEIGEQIIVNSSQRKITKLGLKKSSAKILPKGTVLFTSRAGIGNTAILGDSACTNQGFQSIIPNTKLLDTYFIFSRTKELKDYGERVGAGSTFVEVSGKQMAEMELFIPKLEEQKVIGSLFKRIDNLITLHQNKHDKLTEIKNSLLEKMFPKNNEKIPEIRFKGFHNDWRQYKLDDFGKSTGGVSIESEFSNDGEYKVISIGSYSEMSTYNDQGIRCKLSNRTKDKVLNKDDITMILNDKTSSGNIIGRVLLIDKSGEYVYNQRTERIEINKKEYDPLFIYELLNAPNIRKKIINESQGNTQIYVNWNKIKELLYYVPDIKEQEKLGIYFKNMDNLINLHQNKLNKLKKLKESLLRKMFI